MLYFEHKRLHSILVTSVRRTRHKNRTLLSGLRSSRVWRRAFGVKSAKWFFLDYLTSYLDVIIVKGQAILARSFETPRTTHTITQTHIPPRSEPCHRSRGHSPPFHHWGPVFSSVHMTSVVGQTGLVNGFPPDIYTSSFLLRHIYVVWNTFTVVGLTIFTCFSQTLIRLHSWQRQHKRTKTILF